MRAQNPGEILWSEALVARLSELWMSGTTSGEIGRRLGISRSAVMGKLKRLGLLGRERSQVPIKPPQMPRLVTDFVIPPPPPPRPRPPIGSFDIMDLLYSDCRWPEGNYAPYKFCGDKQAFGSSYCEEHTRRSMSASQPRGTPFYLTPLRSVGA